jgi:hypothetical protein
LLIIFFVGFVLFVAFGVVGIDVVDLGRDSPIVNHYSSTKNSCFVSCVNSLLNW